MKRRVLFSSLFLCLSLASACDSGDEPCAGGSCDRAEADQAGPREPDDTPVPCQPACDAMIGNCGNQPPDRTTLLAVAACVDWCVAGGLTADEATCLAETGCGSSFGCLAE
jgi:hypothetical protein